MAHRYIPRNSSTVQRAQDHCSPVGKLRIEDVKPAQPMCKQALSVAVQTVQDCGEVAEVDHAAEGLHDEVLTRAAEDALHVLGKAIREIAHLNGEEGEKGSRSSRDDEGGFVAKSGTFIAECVSRGARHREQVDVLYRERERTLCG